MLSISFFFNKYNQKVISEVIRQISFLNRKKIDIKLLSNVHSQEEIDFLKYKNSGLSNEHIYSLNKGGDLSCFIFIAGSMHELLLINELKNKFKKVIVVIDFEYEDAEYLSSVIDEINIQADLSFLLNFGEEKYLVPSTSTNVSLHINDKEFPDFYNTCWVPLIALEGGTGPVRLKDLNINYIAKVLDSNFDYNKIHSKLYNEHAINNVQPSFFLNYLRDRVEKGSIAYSYLDYIFQSKNDEYFYLKRLTRRFSDIKQEGYCDTHSLFDPVNSVGLRSQGIKFCSLNPFSSILYNILETLRIEAVNSSRKLPVEKRTRTIVFVLARPFPNTVSEGTNSHYNVLKLFTRLVNIYNKSAPGHAYDIKILISFEKSFSTPFGDKDLLSEKNISDNIELFVNDEIIGSSASLIYTIGKNKKASLEESLEAINAIKPFSTVFLGGTYDSKIFRTMVYKRHPVCLIPTTSTIDNAYGKIDPHFDMIRSINPYHTAQIRDQGISSEKIVHFSKPMFEPLELKLTDWSWDHVNNDLTNRFLLLTPLVGGRISNWLMSLSENEVNEFANIFSRCKSLTWVTIGVRKEKLASSVKKIPLLYKLFSNNRIFAIPFTNDLGSMINQSSALFIPTLGGATTVAAAASLGVPSIVDYRSDSNTIVPLEGQFENFKEAFDKISKVYENNEFKQRISSGSATNLEKRFDVKKISMDFVGFIKRSQEVSIGICNE